MTLLNLSRTIDLIMTRLSTRGAAKKLGIGNETLANYLRSGKLQLPETVQHGERTAYVWTDEDIECVRKLLPKIKNGRKTRYKKNRLQGTGDREQVKPKKKK